MLKLIEQDKQSFIRLRGEAELNEMVRRRIRRLHYNNKRRSSRAITVDSSNYPMILSSPSGFTLNIGGFISDTTEKEICEREMVVDEKTHTTIYTERMIKERSVRRKVW